MPSNTRALAPFVAALALFVASPIAAAQTSPPSNPRLAAVLQRGPLHRPPIRVQADSPEGAGNIVILGSAAHARAAWWVPDNERQAVAPIAHWPSAVRVVEHRRSTFLVESLPSFGRSGGRRFIVPSVFGEALPGSYASIDATSTVDVTRFDEEAERAARPLWYAGGMLCGTEVRCRNIARERARRPVSFDALVLGEPLERRSMTLTAAEWNALIESVYCGRAAMPVSSSASDDRVVPVQHEQLAAAVLSCASAQGVDGHARIVGWIAKAAPIAVASASPSSPRVVQGLRAASPRVRLWMNENVSAVAAWLGEAPLSSAPGVTIAVVVAGDRAYSLLSDATAVRATVLSAWRDSVLPSHVRFADFDGDGLTDLLLFGRVTFGQRSNTGAAVYLSREPGAGIFGDFERDYGAQVSLATDDPDEALRRALAYRPTEFDPAAALRFLDAPAVRAYRAAVERESRAGMGRAVNPARAVAAIRARLAPGARLEDGDATPSLWSTPVVNTRSVDEWLEDFLTRSESLRANYVVCRPRRGYCASFGSDAAEFVFTFANDPQRGALLSSITALPR